MLQKFSLCGWSINLLDFTIPILNRRLTIPGKKPNDGYAWWIEITTKKPQCTYYFGSFSSHKEAKSNCFGYIEDIAAEKPDGISVEIVYSPRPEVLTVFEED